MSSYIVCEGNIITGITEVKADTFLLGPETPVIKYDVELHLMTRFGRINIISVLSFDITLCQGKNAL